MSESIWKDPRITAYVLDELPGDERAEFEQQMNNNSELAAAVAEARGVTSQLGQLYSDERMPPLDAGRREAILATETTTATPVRSQTSWRLPVAIMATAATLLLLLGIAPRLAEKNSNLRISQSAQESSGVEPAITADELSGELDAEEEAEASQSVEMFEDEQGVVHERRIPTSDVASIAGERRSGLADKESDSTLPYSAGASISEANETPSSSAIMESELARRDSRSAPDPAAPEPAKLGSGAKDVSKTESLGKALPADASQPVNRPRTESLSAQAPKTGAEKTSVVTGNVQLETVPELGMIIVKGKKKDVLKMSEAIRELDAEGYSEADDVAAPMLSKQPGMDEARTSGRLQSEQKLFAEDRGKLRKAGQDKAADSDELMVLDSLDSIAASPAGESAAAATAPPASRPEPGAAAYGRVSRLKQLADQTASGTARSYRYIPAPAAPKLPALGIDYGAARPEGEGPGKPGDQFEPITDNPFKRVSEHPLSTFSVDVDTASYSKTRDFLMRANQLPRPDAVRIEELVNYFDYDYDGPGSDADHPFAARAVVTGCPWNAEHRLARIALKGKEMDADERPRCNLVFLIDTSGSMNARNKLPLVQQGMKMLADRLNKKDRVAIVVYAGSAGLVLDSTKVGKNGKEVKSALTRLSAGGSTNGGAGISLAYQTARDNFIKDGVNRVILCTDGDFNVGTTGTDALVRMVEQEAKGGVFLSVLGFGMGNHNDAMLEKISGRGNGNYAFIDTENEARKVLVEQTNATLVTIAKDVKLQVEFNPSQVSSYRLIGYENRILAKEDFNDDKKDAGEIGAGHAVTALYEIVPAGVETEASAPKVDPLKYQKKLKPTEAAESEEMLTLKLRYKQPDGDKSTLIEFPVSDEGEPFADANDDVRFAAAVAGFGMQLRRSEYRGDWTLSDVLSVAEQAKGNDAFKLRAEFSDMVRKAMELMGQE